MLECGFSESLSFIGSVNEILCIFATFSYDLNNISKRRLLFFKKLLNDYELQVNGLWDIRTVLRDVSEFTPVHSTSVLTIRMTLDLTDMHTALLSVCEFRDSWRREGRISFGNVNYIHARTAKPYGTLKLKTLWWSASTASGITPARVLLVVSCFRVSVTFQKKVWMVKNCNKFRKWSLRILQIMVLWYCRVVVL